MAHQIRLSRRGFLLGAIGAGIIATPAAWYGAVYEPNDIEVVRRKLAIRNLPSRLDGLTAVQISDLHLKANASAHSEMVTRIRELNPDVVLFTGDLVDEQAAVDDAVEIFRGWQPPLGTWAVPGNSDHAAYAVDLIAARLKAAKVRLLVNESTRLENGLWIAGVDDPSSQLQNLDAALQDIPEGEARILLAHSPDIVHELVERSFGLVLVGHTHGGQVNLPFFNGAWLLEGASQHYVQGLFNLRGSPLYVNRGIGTGRLPVRIGSRPEITHFTFHAG